MKKLFSLVLLMTTAFWARSQTVSFTINQQPCNNDGIVTATFTGMTPPITVSYAIGMQPPVTHVTTTNTDVLNNYSGAQMWVQAMDANNFTAFGSFSAPPFGIQVSTVAAACPAPGSATATVTGGTAPYAYQWIDRATSNIVGTTNPVSLPAGGYQLIVTDANGCVFSEDSIGVWNNSGMTVTLTSTPASCTNGTISIATISGGAAPYTYMWSNGATTSSINGLTKGSYSVTVTDANGCAQTSFTNVSQNPAITINVTPTPATCVQNDGDITAFASGGVPPYTYLWSNNVSGQSQSNIPTGYYSVTATDANGCTGIGYGAVSSTTPINVTQTTTPSSCTAATGSASLSISGGAAPYSVTWSTSPVQTGTTASNLAPGAYTFHITDANGCARTGMATVPPVNIINAALSSSLPTCTSANGSITATATGGASPYTYSWSSGATAATANNLAAGNYSVTITDAAGCSVTKSKNLSSATPITLGFTTTQASCVYTTDGSTAVTAIGGTSPYTFSWTNGVTTATNNNVLTGNYWVTVADANGCTQTGMTHVPYNPSGNACFCTITGTVYHDANGNCTKDPGETGLPNIQIHCSGFGYTYTDANGIYSFEVPSGNYTISESVLAYYPLSSCQSNGIVQNVTASAGCSQTVDFANSMNPIHDMHVSTWNYDMPIPGFPYSMVTVVSNQGTVTEANIVGGLETDNQLGAPLLTPSNVFTGSNSYYSISTGALSLTPGASQTVWLDYTVPTNIPLSTSLVFKDTVVHTSPISNWLNDYSPWNNVNYFASLTVGSYDPNFKEVMPKGMGSNGLIYPADSVLEYMVHFQNLGTYYAQKVVVVDSLDPDLDWNTLKPIYQSHPCKVTMDENGVVRFTFDNIQLPAKMMNEKASNGMLTYTIRRKSGTPVGTQFTNKAAIYFDYNEPVITNTTLNTLGVPQSVNNVNEASEGSFTLYPNPAGGMFYAQINSDKAGEASLKITDISGKEVMRKPISLAAGLQNIPVNVATLTPGLYFVSIAKNNSVQTQKLVLIK